MLFLFLDAIINKALINQDNHILNQTVKISQVSDANK